METDAPLCRERIRPRRELPREVWVVVVAIGHGTHQPGGVWDETAVSLVGRSARSGSLWGSVADRVAAISPYQFPRFVEIFFRGAPAFGISTRLRSRPGDGSAPTAVIPAALAATVAITQQSKR